ncbi:MAG: molybdopterin dinucleotide binding domain-containing protein [Pseudomonadota bacterium]
MRLSAVAWGQSVGVERQPVDGPGPTTASEGSAQARGRFVVVDPRRTLTARNADRHLPITPGTDAFWLLALAQEIRSQGLASLDRLGAFTSGLDELDAALAPFTPDAVAPRCGIDASVTREIARELAAAPRAAVYGRLGIQAARYGTLAAWATELLNVLTGNLDREGGVMFPLAAHERMSDGQAGGRGFRTGRWRSRVSGHPEVMGELPAAAMAEEIESPGPGQLRAMLTVAGNPVLSTPDGARLDRALATLDFMVSVDMYLNETTRHAQVILPPPSPLERDHYDVVFTRFAIRSVANYSPHSFPSDTPSEESVLLQLAHLASHGTLAHEPRAIEEAYLRGAIERELSNPNSPMFGAEVDEVLASLTGESLSERLLDLLLRTGPFGRGLDGGGDGLDLASLKANPHGIDFGPLRERLPGYLSTPSGTIEFAHDSIQGELARARAELEGVADARWLLIGRRDVHSNNSWMHNLPSLIERPERCTLRLHPDDAASLEVRDGGLVRVRSAVGEVVAPAEVHEEMRRSVVSLPHGYGHGLSGVRQRYARYHAGVSVNDLVPGELDGPSGNAVLNGVAVSISVLDKP